MHLRKKNYIQLFGMILLLLLATHASAQYYRYNKGYNISKGLSVSVMFGPTVFAGDLGLSIPDGSPETKEVNYIGIAYGLNFEKDILDVVSVKLQANKGTLQGQRENSDEIPYVGFTNDFYEFSLGAHVNWNTVFGGFYKYRPVEFYTINTLTLLTFKHYTEMLEGSTAFIPGGDNTDRTHFNYPGSAAVNAVTFVTKVGGGAKFRLDDKWSIITEITGNFAFSDELDGYVYTSKYPRYSAETEDNDFYYMAQVGIEYTFEPAGFRSKSKYNRKSYKYKYKRYKYNPGRARLLRR